MFWQAHYHSYAVGHGRPLSRPMHFSRHPLGTRRQQQQRCQPSFTGRASVAFRSNRFLRRVSRFMSETDIFASSMCNFNIVTLDRLKISPFVDNTRHSDDGIDFVGSEGLESTKVDNMSRRSSFFNSDRAEQFRRYFSRQRTHVRRFPEVALQWVRVRQLPEAVV